VREIIKEIRQSEVYDPKDGELLIEPDDPSEDDPENEVNVVANIAGVTTPLGTGPTYPAGSKRKKKSLPKGWQKRK
jgi:hypothetical protein